MGNCVTFYKSGTAHVTIHFPNGETVCRWCPYARYEENLHRHLCLFTREYLPFPMNTRGYHCPIQFEGEE